jgi:peptidyl-prolyl cis-trans isomerase D
MLERMREGSQGVVAKSILVVIILSFALAGVSGYLGSNSDTAVVTVNGEEISQQSVDQAYQNERASLQQQYGEQFELIASNPNFAQQVRAQATQTLITERLIAQTVKDMGLRVGDEQVKDAIRNMPEFQVNGQFDNDLYLSLLRNNNLTPSQFSANFKRDLVRIQLLQSLVGSEFVLPLEIEQANRLQGQKRVARILNIRSNDFAKDESVSKDEINEFYTANSQLFENPEQVNVEYILLDGDKLKSKVVISDADAKAYYDLHESDYQRVERRKVAHIMIQGTSSEAKQKALDILSELKSGANFSELAKAKSEDLYSASNGGELDWIEPGVMDLAFDESAFKLTSAAPISDIVESKFGFHIIKLLKVENQEPLSFSVVKSQVEATLKTEKLKEIYDDLYQKLSETAFESPDNLETASEEVAIKTITTGFFSASDVPSILDNRLVLNKIFNEDFRNEGLNSEIIELGDFQSIVVRVKDYKSASIKPLSEITDEIQQQLEEQKAAIAAKEFVESLLVKLNSGESVTKELLIKNINFDSPVTVARYSRNLDSQIVQRLFQLPKPEANKVVRDYVVTAQGDFAVIELSKVIELADDTVDKDAKLQLATILERSTSEATYQALVTYLLSTADIEYHSGN